MKRAKKKPPTIGLVTSSLYDQYQSDICAGVQNQAQLHGARVLCFAGGPLESPNPGNESRSRLYDLIHTNNIDALILLTGTIAVYTGKNGVLKFLKQCEGIPAVSIGSNLPGIPSVLVDNEIGMRNLIAHMIEVHGCKNIAFIAGPENNEEAHERLEAYKKTLASHGIPFNPDLVAPGSFEEDSGPNAVRYLVDKKKIHFDALIGVDDRSILFAIDPLKERGFKIPNDIKLAGFDDVQQSQCSFPPLTTVRQPLFEIGCIGMQTALDFLKGKNVPRIQRLSTTIVIRSSCGCSPLNVITELPIAEKKRIKKKKTNQSIIKSLLYDLEESFSLTLFRSDSKSLFSDVEKIISMIIKTIENEVIEESLLELLTENVITYYNSNMTVSVWKEILTCIFRKLQNFILTKKKHAIFDLLWHKSLLTLFHTELLLKGHNQINFFHEIELIEQIGDQLITCFNLNEIKNILTDSLHSLGISECYISLYTKTRKKAQLFFCLGNTEAEKQIGKVFPSKDLIPGKVPPLKKTSFCIQPLVSEHEQIGFALLELKGTNGYLYETLSEKIASGINGARLAEKIKRQNLAMRENESENLRITLNSIGDAVIATDAQMNITRMNPMAEELTGWVITDAIDQPLFNIFNVPKGEIRREVSKGLKQTLEKGDVVSRHDLILNSKEGYERHINCSGAPIRNIDGNIVGVVLVFRDITEQLRLQEQLNHTQKMDSIGQLAGGVAHDFNNMLFGISGAAELISMKAGDNKDIINFANTIIDATEKAAELTQKLLAFSRKAKIQSILLDVHNCITQAIQILMHTIDRKIKINSNLRAPISTIKGDPSQIQNLVLNLGVNARDAMPHGGKLTINTSAITLNEDFCRSSLFHIEPGDYILITVKDTGTGMSKETQNRMFDPFFTTKDIGKGTGLGLSAVYGIVRDHKGAITVKSKLGKGTTFQVYLPITESPKTVEKQDRKIIEKGSGCILIVDDESIVRSTLEGYLKELGYSTMQAEDGKMAVKLVKESPKKIDCIVLDMIMPNMNGVETFKAIKKVVPDMKIIISSGFSKDADVDTLIAHGADAFIQKPFRSDTLSDVLSRTLKQVEQAEPLPVVNRAGHGLL